MSNDKNGENEILIDKIKETVEKIKNDKNPEQLDQIKKFVKKNVPFALRGYFSAYLVRELLNNTKTNRKPNTNINKTKQFTLSTQTQNNTKPNNEEHFNNDNVKTLYLNIGKIKHLFAKDLSKILQEELDIGREDIYFLKVHDKYSFISMSEENCEKAIELLNGKEINGRIAKINYSNRKEEAVSNV